MMNMAYYFRTEPARLALQQVTLWSGFYRPMAGWFYMPIFSVAGLNPAPYHFLDLTLLGAAAYFAYRVARRLGAGELAAVLAALVMCFHGGMTVLYYSTGYIFDVLCGFFYLATMVYYLGIRARGRFPGVAETALLLALTICALNSKEMAVTLPVMLLAYEWLCHRPAAPWNVRQLPAWFWRHGRVAMLTGCLALLKIYGVLFGAGALAAQPGYGSVFSVQRLIASQRIAFADLFFLRDLSVQSMLAIWLLVTFLAWWRKRPLLQFCWLWVLITPLPVEFLEGRGGGCLYIPLAGWAIFAGAVLMDLVEAVAARVSGTSVLRRRLLVAALLGLAVFLWVRVNLPYRSSYIRTSLPEMGRATTGVIHQVQDLHLNLHPYSIVAFLDDPLHTLGIDFIGILAFHDRTHTIWVEYQSKHTPQDLARADHLVDYREGKLILVR